jgi:hypothetical protein
MLRLSHILTTAALVAVCAAPASAATFEQLHANDQNDGASKAAADTGWRSSYQPAPPSRGAYVLNRDYGSPDAVDAAPQPANRGSYVLNRDYGSPDAVDAARDLPPVQMPVIEARNVPSSGFDWGDAGIGAAGMLALFSIAGGAALLLTSRRRGHGIA